MRWAPRADFEDGLLDLVLVSGASKLQMIAESKRIYSGEIAQMTGVREFRATEVVVCPARTV
jgi:diacylglycerol kinase family enzyme